MVNINLRPNVFNLQWKPRYISQQILHEKNKYIFARHCSTFHMPCLAFFFPSQYTCVFLLLKSHFFCNSSTLIRAELKKACSFRIPVPAFLLEGICFTYSESETFSKNTMHVLIPLIKIPPHFQNCCQLLAFVCIS